MKHALLVKTGLLGLGLAIAMPGFSGQKEPNEPNQGKELTEKRDRHAKHFALPNGQFRAKIYSGSQHFLDANNKWQDIDTRILAANGTFSYQNVTNNVKSYFPSQLNLGTGVTIEAESGGMIEMGKGLFTAHMTEDFQLTQFLGYSNSNGVTLDENELVYKSNSITDHQYEIGWDVVKHNVLLKELPASISGQNGFMAFGEDMVLPEGWKLFVNGATISEGTAAQGSLVMVDENGEIALFIPLPDVYEQGDVSTSIYPDGSWPISYYVEPGLNANQFRVMTLVPMEWLNESGRQFPVVVDPTVNCVGGWGGWIDDGSGVVEANPTTFVFVGALSGTDHRGWTKYDITSVPDNSLVTDVEAEFVMNGTGLSGTLTMDVNDVTGAYGPYFSNNQAAWTDFGNGLFTTFQCSTAVTYSNINLGGAANFSVQAELANDEWELGLDNGNNSDWKRFSSGLNNIDVTYIFCTPPTFSIASVTHVDCYGNDNGMVTTTASGGVLPYSYSWTSGDITSDASNLAPGTYIVTITDGTGCFDTAWVDVTQPDTVLLAFTETPVLCNGDATGEALTIPTGGTTPYAFSWSSGGTNAQETGIPAGYHTVTLTDANGCVYADSVMVTEPQALVAQADTVIAVICENEANGSVVTTTSGGIIPYQLMWDDLNGQISPTAINLVEGVYTMMVEDANGCTTSLTENVGRTFDAPVIDLGPNIAANEAFADLIAPAGAGLTFLWSNGANSNQIRVFSNGTYSVIVTDANGCTNIDEITVTKIWATGVEDLTEAASVSMYPNPADNGKTLLEISGLSGEDLNLTITNVQGQIVHQRNWAEVPDVFRENIDLGDEAAGIYFVKIATATKTSTLRLTVH